MRHACQSYVPRAYAAIFLLAGFFRNQFFAGDVQAHAECIRQAEAQVGIFALRNGVPRPPDC
jgi:hypothetical protein